MGAEDRKPNVAREENENTPDEYQELASSGIGNTVLSEPIVGFINADSEQVIEGPNNSYIVLGRDRPSHLGSGYGGKGHSGAGSIDLVVGRQGKPTEKTHPDFLKDSARIHISQKTDIDDNFGIETYDRGVQSSGIGAKADHIRIIGRNSVKIVTNTDTDGEVKNGVELIANNNPDTLQPIVKGENLEEAMNELVKRMDEITGLMATFTQAQMQLNSVAGLHIHNSPFYGTPKTLPSGPLAQQTTINLRVLGEQVIGGIKHFKDKLGKFQTTYLNKSSKEKYINSENNKVN